MSRIIRHNFLLVGYFDLWHVRAEREGLFYGPFTKVEVAEKLVAELNAGRVANFERWTAKPGKEFLTRT